MRRRSFMASLIAAATSHQVWAGLRREPLDQAVQVLTAATASGQVASAVLHVTQGESVFTQEFGKATTADAMFLLGSISKPICITALMTLYDRNEFRLDDPVKKFLPDFTGDGRDLATIRHLLTHVSGLPDQVPQNNLLRQKHAGLAEFVEHALRAPLSFAPGERYQYSSMGILLASHIAEKITGQEIQTLVDQTVFKPLKMRHSAQGLGRFARDRMVAVQTEHAAPESGGGDPNARNWDWNSPYWRKLGAPWGGTHASAPDVGKFLLEFLDARGVVIQPQTARLMISNQNAPKITPRGVGFQVGATAACPGCSAMTFGHTGSTGTICWADPATNSVCVILTSLPGSAVNPHPREQASARVAAATTTP